MDAELKVEFETAWWVDCKGFQGPVIYTRGYSTLEKQLTERDFVVGLYDHFKCSAQYGGQLPDGFTLERLEENKWKSKEPSGERWSMTVLKPQEGVVWLPV